MRKLIASVNITPDGFCDHNAVIADEESHQNSNALLRSAGTLLFGRVTDHLWKVAGRSL